MLGLKNSIALSSFKAPLETYLSVSGDVLAVSGDKADSQRLIGEARIISPWTLWGGNRITGSLSARYDIYNFEETPIYNDGVIYYT